jgi:hypothetical protein
LLIKHRDKWSGNLDIGEFAPLSVKSEGDFADILAQDNPAIWISSRPAEGGETGALFKRIIAQALEMNAAKGATRAKGSSGAKSASEGAKGAKRAVKAARKRTKTQ